MWNSHHGNYQLLQKYGRQDSACVKVHTDLQALKRPLFPITILSHEDKDVKSLHTDSEMLNWFEVAALAVFACRDSFIVPAVREIHVTVAALMAASGYLSQPIPSPALIKKNLEQIF